MHSAPAIRLAQQVDFHGAVGDSIEEVRPGTVFGEDSLQQLIAAETGDVDAEKRVFHLKGIGQQLTFARGHRSIEADPSLFLCELQALLISRAQMS
jgi:hypothetical protein